jgi:hypothetical protein
MMTEVTVKVPEERVAEFYVAHGQWLEKISCETAGHARRQEWTTKDGQLARDVWSKLPVNSARFLEEVIDAGEIEGAALVRRMGLNDVVQLVGLHGWVGRVCNEFGRTSPVNTKATPNGTAWFIDQTIGKMLKDAR